ncbi:MAG: outer membrane protein assembly factor BamE [bacterium]
MKNGPAAGQHPRRGRHQKAMAGAGAGAGMVRDNKDGRGPKHGLSWMATLGMVLSLVLAACAPIYTNHGYIPTDEDLSVITVGVDTRDSVSATIGRPTVEGLLGDEAWYYVQSRFKTFGASEPVEISREVVAISFNPDGRVANVERFGLDQGRIVPLSRRITTTNIRGKSILSQIFGNIGKLNTDNLFK